jgi:hypothetical protein
MFDPLLQAYVSTLDVTKWPQRGSRLTKKVIEQVKPNEFIFTPPPSVIEMTQEQYDSLVDQEELEFMQEYSELANHLTLSKQKLFYTPNCVMEVRLKGVDYATEAPKDNQVS